MKNIIKICDKCGSTERTPDGKCRPCRKIYMTKFRAEKADKIRASKQAWNARNAEKVKAQNSARCKKWLANNSEKAKLRADEWAKANPEKVAAAKAAWLAANPEKHKAATSGWAKRNRPARRIHWQNYKARKLAAGGTFTPEDIKAILRRQKRKCVVCWVDISKSYHIDHIMPLFLGGSNDRTNIQLLCPHCNTSKQAKHPIDFMQSRGFLL